MSAVFVCCKELGESKYMSPHKKESTWDKCKRSFYLVHVGYKILQLPHPFTDSGSSNLKKFDKTDERVKG